MIRLSDDHDFGSSRTELWLELKYRKNNELIEELSLSNVAPGVTSGNVDQMAGDKIIRELNSNCIRSFLHCDESFFSSEEGYF